MGGGGKRMRFSPGGAPHLFSCPDCRKAGFGFLRQNRERHDSQGRDEASFDSEQSRTGSSPTSSSCTGLYSTVHAVLQVSTCCTVRYLDGDTPYSKYGTSILYGGTDSASLPHTLGRGYWRLDPGHWIRCMIRHSEIWRFGSALISLPR